MKKLKRICKILFRTGLALFLCLVLTVIITNIIVTSSAKKQILTLEQAAALEDIDCILVLGCGVRKDGKPTSMLMDRISVSLEVYDTGVTDKILMSGDHGREGYDEVNVMKSYATEYGVADENVFMDHAGFSTYESVYRAVEIFGAKKVIIVTQGYHLPRAIFLADALGLEAYGVAADKRSYSGQAKRDVREWLARTKDCFMSVLRPEPTYLGEAIPISGNGNATND